MKQRNSVSPSRFGKFTAMVILVFRLETIQMSRKPKLQVLDINELILEWGMGYSCPRKIIEIGVPGPIILIIKLQ